MKLYVMGVFVDDQTQALAFYTDVLGFKVKTDMPAGEYRWLTVTDEAGAIELLLEPSAHRAVAPYRDALRGDGIPLLSLKVDDIAGEVARLKGAGVVFTQDVVEAGPVKMAIFDDTCGNLVQLIEMV